MRLTTQRRKGACSTQKLFLHTLSENPPSSSLSPDTQYILSISVTNAAICLSPCEIFGFRSRSIAIFPSRERKMCRRTDRSIDRTIYPKSTSRFLPIRTGNVGGWGRELKGDQQAGELQFVFIFSHPDVLISLFEPEN